MHTVLRRSNRSFLLLLILLLLRFSLLPLFLILLYRVLSKLDALPFALDIQVKDILLEAHFLVDSFPEDPQLEWFVLKP